MDDKTLLIVIIIFLIVLSILVIKYGKVTNANHSYSDRDEEDDNNESSDNKKTEQFYDDLAFTFPNLDKVDEPIDTLKYLFENKTKVTEEILKEHCKGVSNFKNENGVISFDTEATHFDFYTAKGEVKIDDSIEVSSNRSGLSFFEEGKSLTMAFHKENGEYVVDDYSINNPEGISYNIEDDLIESNTDVMEKNSIVDNEIIVSDTSY